MFIQFDMVDKGGNTIHRFRDGRDFETLEEAEDALREQGFRPRWDGWWIKEGNSFRSGLMARIFGA